MQAPEATGTADQRDAGGGPKSERLASGLDEGNNPTSKIPQDAPSIAAEAAREYRRERDGRAGARHRPGAPPLPPPIDDAIIIAIDGQAGFAAPLAEAVLNFTGAINACDPAGVEAYLWQIRRILTEAIKSWRELVPPLEQKGAKQ